MILPIVIFAILFVSQLYMIYLVEAPRRRNRLGQTYGLLALSMIFLPIFGTVVGLYLLIRLSRDPQAQHYYATETPEA